MYVGNCEDPGRTCAGVFGFRRVGRMSSLALMTQANPKRKGFLSQGPFATLHLLDDFCDRRSRFRMLLQQFDFSCGI
jgi:hypothetical protein